jgi:hypothetical protein
MFGQGDISFVNNPAAGGGGGTVTAMRNGLSLVGTAGELGLNPLLHDTAFDLAGYEFQILNGANPALYLYSSPGVEQAQLASAGANNVYLILDDQSAVCETGVMTTAQIGIYLNYLTDNYFIGDTNGISTGMFAAIFASNSQFQVRDTAGRYMDLNKSGGQYQMGDIDKTNNGVFIDLDDTGPTASLQQKLNIALFADWRVYQYWLGDYSQTNNSLRLLVDDAGRNCVVYGSATNQRLLALSLGTGDYSFGDLDVIANGNRMIIHDTLQTFNFVNGTNGVVFKFDTGGIQYLTYWKIDLSINYFRIVDSGFFYLGIDPVAGLDMASGGANPIVGNATLIAGTVTVSNANITANTLVFLSRQSVSAVASNLSYVCVPGSFTITSSDPADVSIISWMIVQTH